jgi:hypothetical protein
MTCPKCGNPMFREQYREGYVTEYGWACVICSTARFDRPGDPVAQPVRARRGRKDRNGEAQW